MHYIVTLDSKKIDSKKKQIASTVEIDENSVLFVYCPDKKGFMMMGEVVKQVNKLVYLKNAQVMHEPVPIDDVIYSIREDSAGFRSVGSFRSVFVRKSKVIKEIDSVKGDELFKALEDVGDTEERPDSEASEDSEDSDALNNSDCELTEESDVESDGEDDEDSNDEGSDDNKSGSDEEEPEESDKEVESNDEQSVGEESDNEDSDSEEESDEEDSSVPQIPIMLYPCDKFSLPKKNKRRAKWFIHHYNRCSECNKINNNNLELGPFIGDSKIEFVTAHDDISYEEEFEAGFKKYESLEPYNPPFCENKQSYIRVVKNTYTEDSFYKTYLITWRVPTETEI